MPRRAADSKNAISRKEQNRINQRAFRERKRREFDDMREALACMKATNAGAGPKVRPSENDVDNTNPITDHRNESANLPSDETVCPADLGVEGVFPGSSMIDDGCSGITKPAVPETKARFLDANNWGVDEFIPGYTPTFDHTQAALDSSGALTTNQSYLNNSYSGEDWYPKQYQDITQVHETTSHCNVPPLNNGSLGQPTDIATDYNNAQTFALKSAEWYAKAAEVGLLKIATFHHQTHTCMPTWQQSPPTYTAPTSFIENIEDVRSGPVVSLNYDGKLPSEPSDPFDFNYGTWSQELTQAW